MSTSPQNPRQSQHQHPPPPSSMVSSILTTPRPPGPGGPRRPKLSLQTTLQAQSSGQKGSQSAAPAATVDSPTSRNTHSNTRGGLSLSLARGSPTSPRHSKSANTSPRTFSPLSSSGHSPKANRNAPYALPHGPRPILRNSPLKGSLASPLSPRSPRRAPKAKKQVLFREVLVEIMPTPVVDEPGSDSEAEATASASSAGDLGEHGETKMPHRSTPINRRKKQREWVWTIGSDSPGDAKFQRDADQKPIYPRTPIPDGDDSEMSSDSSEDRTPSQIPLPTTPATPASAKEAKSPSRIPLPRTPTTPRPSTPRTPSQVPLPDTPLASATFKDQ